MSQRDFATPNWIYRHKLVRLDSKQTDFFSAHSSFGIFILKRSRGIVERKAEGVRSGCGGQSITVPFPYLETCKRDDRWIFANCERRRRKVIRDDSPTLFTSYQLLRPVISLLFFTFSNVVIDTQSLLCRHRISWSLLSTFSLCHKPLIEIECRSLSFFWIERTALRDLSAIQNMNRRLDWLLSIDGSVVDRARGGKSCPPPLGPHFYPREREKEKRDTIPKVEGRPIEGTPIHKRTKGGACPKRKENNFFFLSLLLLLLLLLFRLDGHSEIERGRRASFWPSRSVQLLLAHRAPTCAHFSERPRWRKYLVRFKFLASGLQFLFTCCVSEIVRPKSIQNETTLNWLPC